MYPADVLVGVVALSLLAASFVSALGVLISLKARTQREAQQVIAISSLVIPFAALLILPSLPAGVQSFLTEGGLDGAMLIAGLLLLALTVMLTYLAFSQFKRTKLMAHV
jgi:hypothetical protein